MKENTKILSLRIRIFGVLIVTVPHITSLISLTVSTYTKIPEALSIISNPFFIIELIAASLLCYIVIETNLRKILTYHKFKTAASELSALKTIKNFPKLMIVIPLLLNMGGLQIILYLHPESLINWRTLLFTGFGMTVMTGLPFYTLFIRSVEFLGHNIDYNAQYKAMSMATRNILVIFLTLTSATGLVILGIIAVVGNAETIDYIKREIVIRILPLGIVSGFLAIVNNYMLVQGISSRLKLITRFINKLSEGDISQKKIEIISRDEFGQLFQDINLVIDTLQEMIGALKKTTDDTLEIKDQLLNISEETSSAGIQISQNIKSVDNQITTLDSNISDSTNVIGDMTESIGALGEDIEEQASMVEESTASITEMIASIDNITSIAHRKAQATGNLINTARTGGEKLNQTMEAIKGIHASIENIKEIISLIVGISARTNLLSMNAAIEAAHAGDAGRGFSVVADEVRKLAVTSSQSSKKINENIKDIIGIIEASSESADVTLQAFEAVNNEIQEVVNSFNEIEAGVSELKIGGDQILKATHGLQDISIKVRERAGDMTAQTTLVSSSMENVSRISAETKTASQEITRGTEEIISSTEKLNEKSTALDQYSAILKDNVEKFKI